MLGRCPGEEGGAQCWLWNKAQQLLTTAGKSSGPGPSMGREKGWAKKSPLAHCHHSLLTAAGASEPTAPWQERVGAGWPGHLSPHAANCSNPRMPGPAGPNGQGTGLAAPPTALYPVPWEVWGEGGGAGAKVCGLIMSCRGLGCPRDPEGRMGRARREWCLRRSLVIFLANGRGCRPFKEAPWSL